MRVLVTGGAGYIGSHVAWSLAEYGHQPIVFDNLSTGHADAPRFGPLIQGDLCNEEQVISAFAEGRPEAVMHFAARSLVGESVINPRVYFHDNIVGALNLLTAMDRHGVKHLVFSSTAATYGAPRRIPIDETHPQIPTNPYGDSKLAIERMLKAWDAAYGLRFAALRYFNAAGALPAETLGERHDPETHLIPLILQVPRGLRQAIAIFGRDYDTDDGTCIRDYIHVLDLAAAHIAALEHLVGGGESLELNLGTGEGSSVLEVIEAARRITGKPIPTRDAQRRAGDPPRLVAATDRAQSRLDWRCRHDLSAMIESAWRFYTDG